MRYDYHRDHGHETDQCRSLKFLVEKLIKVRHLKRYLREVDQGMESGQPTSRITTSPTTPPEPRPTINYIMGCLANDQYQSKREQKKLVKAAMVKARVNDVHTKSSQGEAESIDGPIFFPSVNPNRVIVPHYDALVLTLYINGFDVHRVLVDPSSVADLLQLPAFIQMKLSSSMLNSVGRILSGFNGATTAMLGDVTLPMKAEPVTQWVLFSIVEDLGPYNAIVGRTWLHSMKVVHSMYHQMVSYLTHVRQVDLLSSQLAAHQCYQLSMQEQGGKFDSEQPALDESTHA